MAENTTNAWDKAFARVDQSMGRAAPPAPAETPPANPVLGASAASRLDDLTGRVEALEHPAPDGRPA